MARKIPIFSPAQLEAVCKVLGHTDTGLTGTEIGHTLAQIGVGDPDPTMTKWKRLYNALAVRQNQDRSGDRVFAFISRSMDPARYHGERDVFDERRRGINVTLSYLGYEFGEDGKFHTRTRAQTIGEAESRADRLRSALETRGVHQDVLQFCRAELLQKNYFHAVLEAVKSVADKIRVKSGLANDGADLTRDAFAFGKSRQPVLAINILSTETEKGEQKGFMNLLIGLFGTFRNPTAHAPKIYWPIDEQDALDILSLVSLVHRKLDQARKI